MEKKVLEREINLIDMFWAVCLKWRQIMLWAIVFAILVGGIGYYKNIREMKSNLDNLENEVSLEEIELDDNEKNNVEAYIEYKQMYKDQVVYNETAPLMQLDANGFYRNTLTYYVDNHYTVEYPIMSKNDTTDAIIEAYEANLQSEIVVGKLKEITGDSEKSVSYVKELIDFTNRYGNLENDENKQGILTISIYGKNEQECREIAHVIKETIDSEHNGIVNHLGEHEINLIEDSCNYVADVELMKYQQENISKLVSYTSMLRDLKNKLVEDELLYIETYEKQVGVEKEATSGEVLEQEVNESQSGIDKVYIVLGFIVGIVLSVIFLMIAYLSNKKLMLEDDFRDIFGIKLLGSVVTEQEKNKKWFSSVDKMFIKFRHANKRYFKEEEAVSMVAAGIKIGATKLEKSKIYVIGANVGEKEKRIVEKLKKELKNTNIELIAGKSILYDAEALEKAAEVGSVLLVEQVGGSLYSEIAKEIEICVQQDTKIVGAVVVS